MLEGRGRGEEASDEGVSVVLFIYQLTFVPEPSVVGLIVKATSLIVPENPAGHPRSIFTVVTGPVTTSAHTLDASEARRKRAADNEVNFILGVES